MCRMRIVQIIQNGKMKGFLPEHGKNEFCDSKVFFSGAGKVPGRNCMSSDGSGVIGFFLFPVSVF